MKKLLILFCLCAFLAVPVFAADVDSTKPADSGKQVEKKAQATEKKAEDSTKKVENKTTGKGIGKTAGKSSAKKGTMTTTKSGLKFNDEKIGTGAEAKAGDKVQVNYTGWLYENGTKGKQFDSSVGRGPLDFTLGNREVIQGWEEGVAGMKEGGKRTLIIPSKLAYGEGGYPGLIPPNSTLMFDVELVKIVK